jgi:hypothetical protein
MDSPYSQRWLRGILSAAALLGWGCSWHEELQLLLRRHLPACIFGQQLVSALVVMVVSNLC